MLGWLLENEISFGGPDRCIRGFESAGVAVAVPQPDNDPVVRNAAKNEVIPRPRKDTDPAEASKSTDDARTAQTREAREDEVANQRPQETSETFWAVDGLLKGLGTQILRRRQARAGCYQGVERKAEKTETEQPQHAMPLVFSPVIPDEHPVDLVAGHAGQDREGQDQDSDNRRRHETAPVPSPQEDVCPPTIPGSTS